MFVRLISFTRLKRSGLIPFPLDGLRMIDNLMAFAAM